MKQRDNLDDRQRQLTYFAACAAGTCQCRGFRPVLTTEEEVTTERRASRAERDNDYAPMARDLEALETEDVIECRVCGHSIGFHAEAIKSLSAGEVETFSERILDLQSCCEELSEIDPSNESLQTLYIMMQVLLKSLRTLSPIEIPFIGLPQCDPDALSCYQLVKKFIASKHLENSDIQPVAEIGTHFLSELNHWKLNGYDNLKEFLNDPLEAGRYRSLFARIDYYVNMPSNYISLKQYQIVDIFGSKILAVFCEFMINSTRAKKYTPYCLSESDFEENIDSMVKFSKELKQWLATEETEGGGPSTSKKRESNGVHLESDISLKYVKRKRSGDEPETPEEEDAPPTEETKAPRRQKKERETQQPSTSTANKKSPETTESLVILRSLIRAMKLDGDMDAMEPKTKLEFEALNTEVSRGMNALKEEEVGLIEFRVIGNDLDPFQHHEQLAQLVELQILFGVQLPKMPKDYVTRLIFDSRHQNMVILKKDVGVIGGICFRQFPSRGFVEIVFCAITAMEQVKGYGTHLMNHCKDYMIKNKIYHMLTFADEFAIGYFTKQGFSNKLEINPTVYHGWIKEYEGATLMGCHLHPQISYTKFADFSRGIQALHCGFKPEDNDSRKVFGGLEHVFRESSPPLLELRQVPGTETLKIGKKTCYQLDERDDNLDTKIASILKKLNAEKNAWPFAKPVDPKEVPEYYDFIQHPIDLKTMHDKLKNKAYVHQHLFIADLTRMFQNCYSFNAANTVYYKWAYKLNEMALKLLKSAFPESSFYPALPALKPHN